MVLGRGAVSYERGTPIRFQIERNTGARLCGTHLLRSSDRHSTVNSQQSTVNRQPSTPFFFFFTLVTGSIRSLRLHLSDTRVYELQIRARLGTTAQLSTVHRPPSTVNAKSSTHRRPSRDLPYQKVTVVLYDVGPCVKVDTRAGSTKRSWAK